MYRLGAGWVGGDGIICRVKTLKIRKYIYLKDHNKPDKCMKPHKSLVLTLFGIFLKNYNRERGGSIIRESRVFAQN